MSLEIIILAAGQGTRMRSTLPKVLHQVGGKSMLQHVVETSLQLNPKSIHVVTGYGSDTVKENTLAALGEKAQGIRWVLQKEQKGTGHAVAQAMPEVDNSSTCLILYGDSPLVNVETLRDLCAANSGLSLMTAKPENPEGLGRIVRDSQGKVTGIIEHKDATEEQRLIGEINSGIMACRADLLNRWVAGLDNRNSQGEYYLTDIVAKAVTDGEVVRTDLASDPNRLMGVNSCAELAVAERVFQNSIAQQLMRDGVTLMDPARLDVRGEPKFGSDCIVDINVFLEGNITIGNNVFIGPNCVVRNSIIGDHCRLHANSIIDDATLGDACEIGPFARVRPGTELSKSVKIGNFVEVKKSTLGEGSKANHLAYVGDSTVGNDVNIGAGVITCNYDGANKSQTIIGNDVFVGSDSQLVAPVEIGDGVTIGAGSTITRNVEADMLAISRAQQKSIANWRRPKKK
ncbi:MAG: bifunctional UDP-N-acetylglucosamine diphosphorylase/glucosamine-1-phosphate N-acetyltransferase GlmU [bacterium]